MPLFEVAILESEKRVGDKISAERLVMEPKYVLAKDGQAAAMKAVLESKEKLDIDYDRMNVIVRPFG